MEIQPLSNSMGDLSAIKKSEESSKEIFQAAQDLKEVEKVENGTQDQEALADLKTLNPEDEDKGNILDLMG